MNAGDLMYVCHNYNLEVIKTTIVRVSARQVASEAIIKLNWKVWYLITLLKLPGLGGI